MIFSCLFIETMTIREVVDNCIETDGKKLEFHPENFDKFLSMFKGNKNDRH